jgi:hypothetical protein
VGASGIGTADRNGHPTLPSVAGSDVDMVKVKTKRLPMAPAARPFYDPERDGVTQGILATFKRCRQLARDTLSGWTGKHPSFPLVYGGLVHHVLRSAYLPVLSQTTRAIPSPVRVQQWLEEARTIWLAENPIRSDVATAIFEEALMKSGAILPSYFKYWKDDFLTRQWVELEQTFRIPWSVTAYGRTFTTFLRGRVDGVYVSPTSKRAPRAPRLMETKTATDINEELLVDTLPMNLQTSMYLIATEKKLKAVPVEVEYNVIRKTALRQGKAETWQQYEQRIIADVRGRLDWYFVRMYMTVSPKDLAQMRHELDELIGDFLSWWYGYGGHYRNDQSCYLFKRPCAMIKLCAYNDPVQLFKRATVFSELED